MIKGNYLGKAISLIYRLLTSVSTHLTVHLLSCPPNGSSNAFFYPNICIWRLRPVPRYFQRTADSIETADSIVYDPNTVSDLILAPKLVRLVAQRKTVK
jgi:hypothetical protein